MSGSQQLWRQAIRDPAELLSRLGLEPAALGVSEAALQQFAQRVPEGFVARMRHGDPHDPLLRQVLPIDAEMRQVPGFSLDAVGDGAAKKATGVIQKYRGRALLVTTGSCAINCRYCFRRHFDYGTENAAREGWRDAVDAIADLAAGAFEYALGCRGIPLGRRRQSRIAIRRAFRHQHVDLHRGIKRVKERGGNRQPGDGNRIAGVHHPGKPRIVGNHAFGSDVMPAAGQAQTADTPATGFWDLLRAGGCVVLMRHAQTEPGLGDPPGFTLGQCRTQRNLSEAGRQASRAFGAWLQAQNFKPDAVRSSQWCRCQDTARLAFGAYEDWPALNSTFAGQGDSAAQQQVLRERLLALPVGRTEVWVTHQVIMTGLTGAYPGLGEGFLVDRQGRLRLRGDLAA